MRLFAVEITVALFCGSVKAQSMKEIEDKIYNYSRLIYKWDTSQYCEGKYDSLEKANNNFLDYLNEVLVKNKATLKYDFKNLKGTGIQILSSDDKKFRVYCWNVGGGGGSRSYDALVQYDGLLGNQVKIINDASKEEEGQVCSGSYFSDLFTVRTKSGKNIYFVIGNGKYAAGLYGSDISAYTIEKGILNDSIKIFKTPTKTLNNISFTYEANASINRKKNIDYPKFKVSRDKQLLYVPIIKENDEITGKYQVYKFDGNNYVFDKNAK